jgi:hypothetical protein
LITMESPITIVSAFLRVKTSMVQLLVLGLNVRFFQVLTLGLALTLACVICKGHIALSVPNSKPTHKPKT